MEIKKQSLLTSSLSSDSSISTKKPPEKQWIGHNKRIARHTLGRIDAAAQVALFALLTVASTFKLLGRMTILLGKTICRVDTSDTKENLSMDALVTALCFEKIFRSTWRVLSAPKLKDLCAIDAGKKALDMILLGDYKDIKKSFQEKLKTIKAAYVNPTGVETETAQPKRIGKPYLNKTSFLRK